MKARADDKPVGSGGRGTQNLWPLASCHLAANFLSRKPILLEPAKELKWAVPRTEMKEGKQKAVRGGRWQTGKVKSGSRSGNAHTEQPAKRASAPQAVNEKWTVAVRTRTVKLTVGSRADAEITRLQFPEEKESVSRRGRQRGPETGDR